MTPPPKVLSDCSSDGCLGSEASHRSPAGWLTIRAMVQDNDNAVQKGSSCAVVVLHSLCGAFVSSIQHVRSCSPPLFSRVAFRMREHHPQGLVLKTLIRLCSIVFTRVMSNQLKKA